VDWIAAARREVDGFFAWQLATTRLHEFGPLPVVAGQQAYGVNCMVQAALNLYHATGDPRYARLGGLHASWLLGDNVAGAAVYDPATGRGHDGIDREGDEFLVSRHAGAESTIEALMALQAVLPIPEAARCLAYRPVEGISWAVITPQEQGQSRALLHFTLAREGEYALYVACLRTPGAAGPLKVTIDGARSWTWPPIAQPAGAYRWLVPLTPGPLDLSAGAHTLRVEYPDRDRAADGAIAGFFLHPARATRTFLAPDGARLQLQFDLRLGALDWDEGTGARVGATAGGQ
jgi:hypothetical protein